MGSVRCKCKVWGVSVRCWGVREGMGWRCKCKVEHKGAHVCDGHKEDVCFDSHVGVGDG